MDMAGIEAIGKIPVLGQLYEMFSGAMARQAGGAEKLKEMDGAQFLEMIKDRLAGGHGSAAVEAAGGGGPKASDRVEVKEAYRAAARAERLAEAASLIGTKVFYRCEATGQIASGTVTGLDIRPVELERCGEYRVMVDGRSVRSSALVADIPADADPRMAPELMAMPEEGAKIGPRSNLKPMGAAKASLAGQRPF